MAKKPEQYRDTARRWQKENPQKRAEIDARWYRTKDGRAKRTAYAREWRNKNLEHVRAYKRTAYASNKDKHRVQAIQRKFGISPDEYAALRAAQGDRCAICNQPETKLKSNGSGEPRGLAIDHDHITGKVRGLLCSMCNIGLGNFRDRPELLEMAIVYLRGR